MGVATTQLFIASGIAAHANASITLCTNWTVTINAASYNATHCDPHIASPGEVQWARLELKNAQGAGPSLSQGAHTLVAVPSGNATRGLVDYFEAETAT